MNLFYWIYNAKVNLTTSYFWFKNKRKEKKLAIEKSTHHNNENDSYLLYQVQQYISVYDRARLDTNLQLLSQILTNPLFYRMSVLIVLYDKSFGPKDRRISDEEMNQSLLINLEVAFRF